MTSFPKVLVTLAAAASLSATTLAVQRYSSIKLPDYGFGSDAASGFMDYTDDACLFFGSAVDVAGQINSVVWTLPNAGNSATAQTLPAPSGFQGGAIGGIRFQGGGFAAVGNIVAPNGVAHAVLWRRGILGEWTSPELLFPTAPSSMLNDCAANGAQTELIAAGSVRLNGRNLPVKVNVDISHTFAREILPMASSTDGVVIDYRYFSDGRGAAAGWFLAPNGVRRPCVWIEEGGSWQFQPIPIPQNASGVANGSTSSDNGYTVVGELTRSGRTRGFTVEIAGHGIRSMVLQPLLGFENSTAIEGYNLGDTGTHEVGHWMGYSSTPDGSAVPTVWFAASIGGGTVQGIAHELLMEDLVKVVAVRDGDVGGLYRCGQVEESPSSAPCAYAFRSSNILVPNEVDVLNGHLASEASESLGSLWTDDDQELGLFTRRMNGQHSAAIEMGFSQLGFTAGQDARMDAQFSARIEPGQQVTGGVINVYAFSQTSQAYMQVGAVPVGTSSQIQTVQLPGSASMWRDPASGLAELRLQFVPNENRRTKVWLDFCITIIIDL